jgi:membrane protein implicated in regulation of membrane protease activity
MNWPDFYLLCFLVGFLLSAVSLVTGHLHVNFHHHGGGLHLPKGGMKGGNAAHGNLPWLNFGTVAAFLTWFGGAGYLATHYYRALLLPALGIALIFGTMGASVVFWFLAKVLMGREEHLNPADYDMVGVLGTLSGGIRKGGTGEILFSQEGARRAAGARSEDGAPIAKGIEVIVTRYENGIAYVRRWDELAKLEAKRES